MRKVGIFGGTFDPIHIGHLLLAEHVYESVQLDEIWFMPTQDPPHKDHMPLANGEQRLEMIRLAIQGQAHFRAIDIELKRGGISYTVDTMEELQKLHPDCAFSFLMGADMVNYLPRWHRIYDLARMVRFVGVGRPGTQVDISHLPQAIAAQVHMVEIPLIELSSTEIRERVGQMLPIRYMVPDQVHQFIERNDLYESHARNDH